MELNLEFEIKKDNPHELETLCKLIREGWTIDKISNDTRDLINNDYRIFLYRQSTKE